MHLFQLQNKKWKLFLYEILYVSRLLPTIMRWKKNQRVLNYLFVQNEMKEKNRTETKVYKTKLNYIHTQEQSYWSITALCQWDSHAFQCI